MAWLIPRADVNTYYKKYEWQNIELFVSPDNQMDLSAIPMCYNYCMVRMVLVACQISQWGNYLQLEQNRRMKQHAIEFGNLILEEARANKCWQKNISKFQCEAEDLVINIVLLTAAKA